MGRCARIQSYMSNGDWLNTSRDLLIGYWGVCMWCNDVDWLTSGEVGMISAWSMYVHHVEARWEVTCKELTLFMQLEVKYTCGASLTPHNRNYIHSTCYKTSETSRLFSIMFQNLKWIQLLNCVITHNIKFAMSWKQTSRGKRRPDTLIGIPNVVKGMDKLFKLFYLPFIYK